MKAPEAYSEESEAPLPFPTLSIQARMVVSNLTAALAMTTYYLFAPQKPRLEAAKKMPLTIAGYFAVAFAAFHIAHGWGWLVTGILLVVLESRLAAVE